MQGGGSRICREKRDGVPTRSRAGAGSALWLQMGGARMQWLRAARIEQTTECAELALLSPLVFWRGPTGLVEQMVCW
jgi:hypothetical protein